LLSGPERWSRFSRDGCRTNPQQTLHCKTEDLVWKQISEGVSAWDKIAGKRVLKGVPMRRICVPRIGTAGTIIVTSNFWTPCDESEAIEGWPLEYIDKVNNSTSSDGAASKRKEDFRWFSVLSGSPYLFETSHVFFIGLRTDSSCST